MLKILSGVLMILAVASSSSVEAAPFSWNLSRDMMRGITLNPFGTPERVWTAMYDKNGTSHIPSNYQQMPTYNPNYLWGGSKAVVWENTAQDLLVVGVSVESNGGSLEVGIPFLNPGPTFSSIIRWKSPVNGNVNIMGRISDANFFCNGNGKGIKWFVDKENFTLMSGKLANGSNGVTILQQNIPVSVGTCLYFIVSPNSNDNSCDTTYLDVVITKS